MISPSTTDTTVMTTLLRRSARKSGALIAEVKFSIVACNGSRFGWNVRTSFAGLNAVTTIQ